MKALNILIKLTNTELDKKKIEIANLRNRLQEIVNTISKIDSDLIEEQKYAIDQETSSTYSNYIKYSIDKKNFCITESEKTNLEIEQVQEEIFEKFRELKRFKKLLDNKKLKLAQQIAKKEEQQFDELRANKYSKLNSNNM